MAQQKINAARFALYGALGFGVGGLFFGAVGLGVGGPIFGMGPSLIFSVLLMGALGGLSLGLAMKLGRNKLLTLALVGGLIIFLGPYIFIQSLYLTDTGAFFIGKYWTFSLIGIFTGALLGTLFAVVIDRRLILRLGLAGTLGFGLGFLGLPFGGPGFPWIGLGLAGLIGGASLGAALGYLYERGLLPAIT